jgi:hypothetical protein
MDDYTIADAQTLNTIKNRLRDIVRLLDSSQKVYPDALEASQVKHEVTILLSELAVHGLLPIGMTIAPDATQCGEPNTNEKG